MTFRAGICQNFLDSFVICENYFQTEGVQVQLYLDYLVQFNSLVLALGVSYSLLNLLCVFVCVCVCVCVFVTEYDHSGVLYTVEQIYPST